jgi:hypothetical protein
MDRFDHALLVLNSHPNMLLFFFFFLKELFIKYKYFRHAREFEIPSNHNKYTSVENVGRDLAIGQVCCTGRPMKNNSFKERKNNQKLRETRQGK